MSAASRDDTMQDRLLEAILPHVAFDGWSEASFQAACRDCDLSSREARLHCARGALDLAILFHENGDKSMQAMLAASDLSEMRFRDKVAHAVKIRLELVQDKEAVRRGATLFALPQNAAIGARLLWGTADAIWTALGDTSRDVNWYTKRATLSAVYSTTVLYWLGDDSIEHEETWAFLDRRIENVMQFEKVKGQMRDQKSLQTLFAGPAKLLSKIRAPESKEWTGRPGFWKT